MALGDKQYLEKYAKEMVGPLQDIAEGASTLPFEFEFTTFGINKGNCLKQIIKLKGWSVTDLYGFRDGDSDISLLKTCHYKIAMANGSASLKKKQTS